MDVEKLQQQVDLLMENISGFEENAIAHIMQRINKIGKLNSVDKKSLENLGKWTLQDTNAIASEMTKALNNVIPEAQEIMSNNLQDTAEKKSYLYEYRGIEQIPFADDERAKSLIKTFSRETGKSMINLSRTKALYLVAPDGITKPFATSAQEILDKAVFSVVSGVEDYNSAMRNAIKLMGGNGVKVEYQVKTKGKVKKIRRHIDNVIRQNILYSTKTASIDYDRQLSKELGCDGVQISRHSHPRKSHEYINGKIFSKDKDKVVNGVKYENDRKAQSLLKNYGCLHDEYGIILGASEPQYSKEELERLAKEDTELVEYNGKKLTRNEWQTEQRYLERRIKEQKREANAFKASGDMQERRITQTKINALTTKYNDLVKATGLQATPERSQISGFRAVKPSE